MTDQIRRLFFWLVTASLLFAIPSVLLTARGALLVFACAACAVLLTSWSCGRVLKRAPLALDLVDALALFLLAQALPTPEVSLLVVTSSLWFRGLYGSTTRALMRSTLYSVAFAAAVLLWPLFHEAASTPDPGVALGAIPALFLTVLIVRPLSVALNSREQAMQRDRELVATGTLLLGAVDATAIAAIGLSGARNLCAATPGLRVLRVVQDGATRRVTSAAGNFLAAPREVSHDVFSPAAGAIPERIVDSAPLDAAAGSSLAWTSLATNDGEDVWFLVGAPKAVPPEALVSIRALANQVALAMRNSSIQHQLVAQASRDLLTGLDNRACFMTKLTSIVAETRHLDSLHVLFLDLDDFKNVNDVLGHRAGNDLLVTVAERMNTNTRPGDVCARLGGDEFAVILVGTSEIVALEIADRLGRAIAVPIRLAGNDARVGVSIGVATATPGVGMEDLVHRADVAMYAAKARGKNRVQLFEPALLRR